MTAPAVEAVDVGLVLPGTDRRVLDAVSVAVRPGESLALTGPSGSGKSTLLGLLAGLLRPTSGAVLRDGVDLAELPTASALAVRRRTGVVFQGYGLLTLLTGAENVELALQARGTPPEATATATARVLAAVGLAERAEHLVEELSGGEQQRVAVARALAGDPEVVLADEPTAELDEERAALVLDLLLEVPRSGRTLIVATHDDEVAARCDLRLRLRAGRTDTGGP